MYTATSNVTGYLPDDEPVEFDSATDAWKYLRGVLDGHHMDCASGDGDGDDEDHTDTQYEAASLEMDVNAYHGFTGTVYLHRVGHQLGIAYNVEKSE